MISSLTNVLIVLLIILIVDDLTFAVDELAENVVICQKWSVLEEQVKSLLDNISSIEESQEDVFSSGKNTILQSSF